MAIKKTNELKTPRLVKDFWPQFAKQASRLIVIVPIISGLGVGTLLATTEALSLASPLLWIITVSIIVIGSALNTALFQYATKPTKDLLTALVHISGEKTLKTPPNPNEPEYVKNGFKEVLQTMYELSSKQSSPNDIVASSKDNEQVNNDMSAVFKLLDASPLGFAVLDNKRAVHYATKTVPLHTVDGALQLQLLFDDGNTLEDWLKECEEDAVRAERTWLRVPDRPSDIEGRRIYDVLATYEKGATYEASVTIIERTATYHPDEEDLNFIAFAAHELRGPITIIHGYLDVLQEELSDVLQDEQKELFYRLTVSANRLSGYINNILNTSRYDRRHLSIELHEESLTDIYSTISDDMALRASAQNRILSVIIPPELPTIAADSSGIGEVLGNLIDNAIKYSNEGGAITVSAEAKGDFVEITVADRGIGMPSSVISNLFQKFYRSHRSRETVAGSGIGLYISKAIVESHGGTISVRSVDGEGSTFSVLLPIYATVAEKLRANDNNNSNLIKQGNGWIKNHSMYRG